MKGLRQLAGARQPHPGAGGQHHRQHAGRHRRRRGAAEGADGEGGAAVTTPSPGTRPRTACSQGRSTCRQGLLRRRQGAPHRRPPRDDRRQDDAGVQASCGCAFIANDYLPKTRDSGGPGTSFRTATPGTPSRCARITTTDHPAQIHQIGLSEVARIHGEMHKVMQQVGFKGSLQDFFEHMRTDKQFEFVGRRAARLYRGLEAKVMKGVPVAVLAAAQGRFRDPPGRGVPRQVRGRRRIPEPERTAPAPGIFYVNTYDLPARKTWDAEGPVPAMRRSPGHHFQLALQQELTGVPAFPALRRQHCLHRRLGPVRRIAGQGPRRVRETPYDYFGYLQNRACGARSAWSPTPACTKGLTREQVISTCSTTPPRPGPTPPPRPSATSPGPRRRRRTRSASWKIQEPEEEGAGAAGDKFDPREFHAEILKDGALPLSVLEDKGRPLAGVEAAM